jgi:hypothetical protein
VISPPNAILFVFDPTNKDVLIPSYVDGELTAATETCVSVGTQTEVDGDVEISLAISGAVPLDLQQVFFGTVATPGGKVAVVTSRFQRVLELNVPASAVELSIWTDDLRNPARVVVNIKPAAAS